MPLYECRCERCALTFEVLAPISAARMRSRPCPGCGRAARRIISAVSFAMGGSISGTMPGAAADELARRDQSRSDVTKLTVPPWARLCWMDNKSAARFAAYKHGRGAEYDDTVAAREETRKQRGESAEKPASDQHGHSALAGHSPLADPAVLARRRAAAARKQKVIESNEMLAKTPARPH
jgi:putative FmdB family regulatory protein